MRHPPRRRDRPHSARNVCQIWSWTGIKVNRKAAMKAVAHLPDLGRNSQVQTKGKRKEFRENIQYQQECFINNMMIPRSLIH